MSRGPAVAGMFYESAPQSLERSMERCFLNALGPGEAPSLRRQRLGRIVGLISPHAGYIYSGAAAASAFSALANDGLPDIVVLLGPSHSGMGAPVAVSTVRRWSTPLGELDVDVETANSILQLSSYAKPDELAHAREHSIEVQLPFLQYIGGDSVRIVPISIAHLDEPDALRLISDLGAAIAKAVEGKSAVLIASTDFTHYEPKPSAEARDGQAMEQILKLDAVGLLRVVYGESITMCGVIGTAVMIEAAKALGATSARKLSYYTSGDVTGDTGQVVGYGALSINREP